jgi:hypothetical protein
MFGKYIIRLDDASEFMDYKLWDPILDLCDKFSIKPIIAVIPKNKDPKMIHNHPDANFWDKVRKWQEKGYHIAMHGFEHLYSNSQRGLIGINQRSEFSGISLEQQKKMLKIGYEKFQDEGIKTTIFIAPSHSFDKNTISALKAVTGIENISDGFYFNPICKDGINWLPQQLWKPKIKRFGVWTICLHPETLRKRDFDLLEYFINKYSNHFIDFKSVTYKKNISLIDILFKNYFLFRYKVVEFYSIFIHRER